MELVAPLIGLDWTLLMVLITFVILYFILKKFFFEKVRAFMLAREQKVANQFNDAEAANKLAKNRVAEYNKKMDSIEDERRAILKDGKNTAEQRASEIIAAANQKADNIINQAKIEAEKEKVAAVKSLKDQVAMLAISAAEKILEQKLDAKEHQDIIDDVIDGVGKEKWTH